MKKFLFGLVGWLGVLKMTLEFLNELITFVEKVHSYLHVALYYECIGWERFPDGNLEA